MPLLPKGSFTANVGDTSVGYAGRRASSVDFGAPGLGEKGLVDAGHQLQATATTLLNDMEEKEARDALVKSTEVRALSAKEMDDAVLSGAPLEPIKEKMNNNLAKIGEEYSTKKGSEQLRLYTANSNIMFDQQASNINIQRATFEAKQQGASWLKNTADLLRTNLNYLPEAEKDADRFGETLTNVPAPVRAKIVDDLKKEINGTAAHIAIRLAPDPEKMLKEIEAGRFDLTVQQREQAINQAQSEIRERRVNSEYERQAADRKEHDIVDAGRGRHLDAMVKGQATWASIRDDPAFASNSHYAVNAKKELLLMMEARNQANANKEKQSNQTVLKDLYYRLTAPEGTPNKLYNTTEVSAALLRGDLSVTHANFLMGVGSAGKSEDGVKFSTRLGTRMSLMRQNMNQDPRMGVYDAQTKDGIQMQIMQEAEQKASDIRNGRDGPARSPEGMFDPKSKDFFFKQGLLEDTAAAVQKQALDEKKASAVRVNSVAEMLAQKDGTPMLDPNGAFTVMSPSIRKKLGGKSGKSASGAAADAPREPLNSTLTFPYRPSGER